MNKISLMIAGAACVVATGCGTVITSGTTGSGTSTSTSSGSSTLGSILSAVTNGEALGNAITSVIGLNKLTEKQLYGTWKYDGPGCAFTSKDALAKAGGEVAATQIEEKLAGQYAKVGISSSNTSMTFNEDGTFAATLLGKRVSGNYTYDAKTGEVVLKSLLLSANGFVTRNGSGMSLLFESKKLLSLVQTVATLSGNSTLTTIGDLSKHYDGVRLGFDMKK